ncbi:MAG: hypothetical protein EOO77_16490 [Oxalobacteraceae bacterium]|nr:MAG: hypothetical protein EOO77_16490 [Oxalobacteraceae bacterium]
MLALTAAALGYVSVAYTLGYSLRTSATERGHRLAPADGRITALMAQRLAKIDARAADRHLANRLARAALLQDPTAVVAASTLGLNAQLAGDTKSARRLFSYAEKLSRREFQTEIWAIEDAVGRGDVPGVLHHYDVALRTSRSAPDVLFPILGTAISQPDVQRALLPVLNRAPSWRDPFFQWLIGNGINDKAAAILLAGMGEGGRRERSDLIARLEQNLIEAGDYATAWALYQRHQPMSRRDVLRDGQFKAAGTGSGSPFDWIMASEHGAATIGREGDGYAMTFTTAPASKDVLVKQFELLPPGRYRITDTVSLDSGSAPDSLPYWSLRCVDGRELGRQVLGEKGVNRTIIVPPDCPAQWLALASDGGDAVSGVSGTVTNVAMTPEKRL